LDHGGESVIPADEARLKGLAHSEADGEVIRYRLHATHGD
jgi:hypothetical protein